MKSEYPVISWLCVINRDGMVVATYGPGLFVAAEKKASELGCLVETYINSFPPHIGDFI